MIGFKYCTRILDTNVLLRGRSASVVSTACGARGRGRGARAWARRGRRRTIPKFASLLFLLAHHMPTKEATMPMIVAPRLSTSDGHVIEFVSCSTIGIPMVPARKKEVMNSAQCVPFGFSENMLSPPPPHSRSSPNGTGERMSGMRMIIRIQWPPSGPIRHARICRKMTTEAMNAAIRIFQMVSMASGGGERGGGDCGCGSARTCEQLSGTTAQPRV